MNTHHDILEAARKGEVGKAANCGYYGARPQTILSLIGRGLLQPTYPAVGEVRYRLTEHALAHPPPHPTSASPGNPSPTKKAAHF